MRVGLFASLVDRIQHAYGWTDEVILDLTLRRAIQMQEAIFQREEIRNWEHLRVTEWQTQSLAGMIANTVESAQARKELNGIAQSLSLTGSGRSSETSASPQKQGKKGKKYKLLDGTEIDAKDLHNYEYHEIDHSDEERERQEAVRNSNSGKDLTNMLRGFTK